MTAGLSFPSFIRVLRKRFNISSSDRSTRRSLMILLARKNSSRSTIGSTQPSLLTQRSGGLYVYFSLSLHERRL